VIAALLGGGGEAEQFVLRGLLLLGVFFQHVHGRNGA
jgi:hypothetical protein